MPTTYDKDQEPDAEPPKKGGLVGDADEPNDELQDKEAGFDGNTDASGAEAEEQENLENVTDEEGSEGGWTTNLKDREREFRLKNYAGDRRLMVSAGVLSGVVMALFAALSFFMPNKMAHIIANIENRVGKVPEYAIERRVEYYMNRYLILRQMAKAGVPESTLEKEYVHLGNGPFRTLYTNWKGAELELKLEKDYGVKLKPKNPEAYQRFNRKYVKPSEWELELTGSAKNSALRGQALDSKAAREFIKEFVETETHKRQIIKRFMYRRILKNYFGVPDWHPFEDELNTGKKRYAQEKKKLKQRMVKGAIGVLNKRWGNYMNCVMEGGTKEACKDLRKAVVEDKGTLIGENEIDDITEEGFEKIGAEVSEEVEEEVSKEITEKFSKFGVKKLLASAVAGVGLVTTAAKIVESAENGALSQVVYAKNAAQYAAFTATPLSGSDQVASGKDMNIDQARVLTELVQDYEKSAVYRSGNDVRKKDGKMGQVRDDCNRDGDTFDKEDLLAPGETVCPDRKVLQDKESFTDNSAWDGAIVPIAKQINVVDDAVLGKVTDAIKSVTDFLKINDAIAGALTTLGISAKFSEGMEAIFSRISAPVVTGAEVGKSAYDALFAGISVNRSSLGGGVGENREETIGGAYLTTQQVAQIKAEQYEERQTELRNKPVFARYFSPDIPESLTSQAIMYAPTSVSSFATKFGNLLKPATYANSISNAVSADASAQAAQVDNPFDVIYFGYPSNAKIFTDNNGEGMEHDELWKRYQCDKPSAERSQNREDTYKKVDGLPFAVPTQTDPCLLEKTVEDVGSRYFTGKYDEGIDENSSGTSTGGATGILAPGALAWPAKIPSTVTSCYGPRWESIHRGVDISAGLGSPVFAAAAGTVTVSPDPAGYGPNYVIIRHEDGTATSYGHMRSINVASGDHVNQAQQIGEEGSLGRSTGPHLHFNVYLGADTGYHSGVDPLKNGLKLPPGINNQAGCATS